MFHPKKTIKPLAIRSLSLQDLRRIFNLWLRTNQNMTRPAAGGSRNSMMANRPAACCLRRAFLVMHLRKCTTSFSRTTRPEARNCGGTTQVVAAEVEETEITRVICTQHIQVTK